MIGIGIGIPFVAALGGLGVAVTSPAAGTTFYVDTAQSVSLAGPDATYETSFVSDFATTNGDITVSSGTGSGNVTAAWADGIATVERTTLYIRDKAVGGAATASLTVAIYTGPEAAVQDGTVLLAYDLGRASTVTQGAGVCTEWQPIVGGTSADYLQTFGAAPTYNATDSLVGGRPSIQGNATDMGLQSQTPGSAVNLTPHPVQVVAIGVGPSASGRKWLSAGTTNNRNVQSSGTYWEINSGTLATSSATVDTSHATLLVASFGAGTDSVVRDRQSDGDLGATPLLDAGTTTAGGFTIFNRASGAQESDGRMTALLAVTDLSPADIYRLEQWYQLSAVRGGCAATGWTAQLDATCYLGVAGWWPTDPTDGVVSEDNATIDDDLSTWSTSDASVAGSVTDPLGGSAAFVLRETTDAIDTAHYIYKARTAWVSSYCDWDIWAQPVSGGRDWLRGVMGTSVSDAFYLNVSTGAVGSTGSGDVTAVLIETVGTWRHWRVSNRRFPSANCYLESATADGTYLYTGDGRDCFNVYLEPTRGGITQTRVANIADQSGVGADLAQATAANQPLFWETTQNGLVIPTREDGRAVQTTSTNATLASVADAGGAAYPGMAIIGVAALASGGAVNRRVCPVRWYDSVGGGYDLPLTLSTADAPQSFRNDGSSSDVAAYSGVAAGIFSTPKAFALICNTDGTRELWVAGAGPYTATVGALLAVSFDGLETFGTNSTNGDADLAVTAVIAGQVPGADAYARMAYLEAALQHEADKYALQGGLLVHFTTAAGTQFINMPSTAIAITAVSDGDYEFSFDSSFATIRGTVTVTSGVGTGTVAPLPADNGATFLYVRDVGGSVALNSLACTVLAVTGWWPTDPTDGTVSVVEPAARDLSLWAQYNLTSYTGGQSDPDGGSGAYSVIEGADLNLYHYVRDAAPTDGIASYWDLDVWLKPAGRTWAYVGTSAANGIYLDLANHVTGNVLGNFSGSFVEASGSWSKWHIESRESAANVQIYVSQANDNRYDGDGSSGIYVYDPVYTQTRIASIADQSGVGADLTQATAANQLLYWDETVNGEVVPHQELGRAAYADSANAALLAALSGDDPAFVMFGIWQSSGTDRIFAALGAGSILDVPLRTVGPDLRSNRNDGTTASDQTWGSGLASLFSSEASFAVIANTDRTRELWVNGTYRATVTMADLASATMTNARFGHATTTCDQRMPALAIYSGQVAGADAAARYATIQPALAIMAAIYGLTT